MQKIKRLSHEEMEAAKIKEDMAMTPEERLLYALRLTDLARALSPGKQLHSSQDDNLKWIELKPKDAGAGK